MEIIDPYIKGLRFLFYSKDETEGHFSFIKLIFLLIYILSIIDGFLQFVNLRSNDLICRTNRSGGEMCMIRSSIFGSIFNLLSLLFIISAFVIITYSIIKNKFKTYYSILGLCVSLLILLTFLAFFITFLNDINSFNESFNAITYAIIILWLLIIEPIIFFNGVIFSVDIISQDYQLQGYGKKTVFFIIVELLIILLSIMLIFYWKLFLFENEYSISSFYNFRISRTNVDLILSGLLSLLFIILLSLFVFFILDKYSTYSKKREQLKALIPWIVLYSIVFFIIRGFPAIFILPIELKSVSDILDVSLVFIVIFFAIFQVVSLPNRLLVNRKLNLINPFHWLDGVPRYAKILLLFFLSAELFYQNLQGNALSFLTGQQNSLITLKATSLVSFIIVGYFSVYFKYKPKEYNPNNIGPIKFFTIQMKKFLP